MATFRDEINKKSINLPEEGQVFMVKGDEGTIYRRIGEQLYSSEIGTFVTPNQGEQFKGKGGALQSAGAENLRRLGINIQSLPRFADLGIVERE